MPKELGEYSLAEWRAWLEPLVEGDSLLDGLSKREWVAWLDRVERKMQEQKELEEASEEASQGANEEPEVAGGSESAFNLV